MATFWIGRNYSRSPRGDNGYVMAPEKLQALTDQNGEVRFRSDIRWSTYIIAHRPQDFEARFPHLALKPGEGPYEVSVNFAEAPRVVTKFAGLQAASLAEATGHTENAKKQS